MSRLTLAMMNGPQALAHYRELISKRFTKAHQIAMEAMKVQGEARRVLDRACNDAMDKAMAMSRPRQLWHADAARERLDRYGVTVAAAFLNANGWSVEAAYFVIFKKPYRYNRLTFRQEERYAAMAEAQWATANGID